MAHPNEDHNTSKIQNQKDLVPFLLCFCFYSFGCCFRGNRCSDLSFPLEEMSWDATHHRTRRDDTQKRSNMTMEVKIEMMWPQIKECLDLPGAGKEKDRFCLRVFEGNAALTDTSVSDFRPMERINFCCFKTRLL